MPSDVGHGLAVHAPMSRDFGDPIAMLIGPDATELDIAHLRRLFGLDEGIGLLFVYYPWDLRVEMRG